MNRHPILLAALLLPSALSAGTVKVTADDAVRRALEVSHVSAAAGEESGHVSKPATARRWRTAGSAKARAAAARSTASAGSGVPGRTKIIVQAALS